MAPAVPPTLAGSSTRCVASISHVGDRLTVKAAENYRLLRGLGITIRASADLIIGTYCIEHGHVLLHDDRDFEPMREHLGLQVL